MIKDFRFLRGSENEEELISQNEWNRRRDALAERLSLYNVNRELEQNRIEIQRELDEMLDNVLKELEKTEEKVSLWSKIWTQLKQPLIFVPVTVFGGLFTLYWILRLVSALIKY